MQVSQPAELDTHAVIGGGAAQAFGISEEAEFFTVLSSTLYRDKIRAVARETICNAWDAHIMVSKQDTAIEITLTDDELIIRDFGPGIPHAKMRGTYCIYGYSSKVKDGKQTGGFGLGAKAPFATSDHFSVANCCEGSRGVYAMSRGGKETDGKPDMRLMVSVPTTETGITVTIPIADKSQKTEFETHIKSVVLQGGIKATLNGLDLPTFDYGQARKTGFALMPHGVYELGEAKVYVLYGTVLYPVSTTDTKITYAADQLAKLVTNGDKARFVLIAPPHSIGVTPSRESLSYSDKTTETIKALLEKATKFILVNGPAAAARVAMERIASFKDLGRWSEGVQLNDYSTGETLITDPMKIAEFATHTRFYDLIGRDKARYLEVKAFAKKYPDYRRFYRRLAARMFADKSVDIHRAKWRLDSRLLVRAASKLGILDSLFVSGDKWLVPFPEARTSGYPMKVTSQIIIARTRRDAQQYAKEESGYGKRMICIVLPKADDDFVEKVEQTLDVYKIDYETMDFTRPEKKKPVKKPKTFFCFDNIQNTKGGILSLEGEPQLVSAPYYVRLGGSLDDLRLPREFQHTRQSLQAMFPGAAVAFDKVQEERLQKAGSVPIAKHMIDELTKLGDSKEVQYAFMAASELFVVDQFRHYSPATLVSKLCAHDLRFAKFFFPAKVPLGAKSARALSVTKMIQASLLHVDQYTSSELRNEFERVKSTIERSARKNFKHLQKEQRDPAFKYLSPLSQTSVTEFSYEHWMDLIAALRRAHDRQVERVTKAEQSKLEMKEAA